MTFKAYISIVPTDWYNVAFHKVVQNILQDSCTTVSLHYNLNDICCFQNKFESIKLNHISKKSRYQPQLTVAHNPDKTIEYQYASTPAELS